MRRLIAGVTGTLVISAVAVVVILPGASSLGAGASSTAGAAPTISNFQMQAPEGRQAVTTSDIVTFSGQVSPPPPQSTRGDALMRFEAANGERCAGFGDGTQDRNVSSSITFGTDGQVSGSSGIPPMGHHPGFPSCHGGRIVVTLTAIENGGLETTVESNALAIDLMGPFISDYQLTAPDTIRIQFSEPVDLNGQPDAAPDWEVDDAPPLAIAGSGDFRTLTIAPARGEDATPKVEYLGLTRRVEGRETYHDSSANNVFVGGEGNFQHARDMIAPRIPKIDQIAGKTGASVFANDATPEVRVSNLTPGPPAHWAELYLEANGNNTFEPKGDSPLEVEDQADSSGIAQIEVPELTNDGTYRLYAIARDNALCDPPQGEEVEDVCPNWSSADAGSTVSYILDRIAPAPLFASVTNLGEVTVGFTEAVAGENDHTDWSISGATVTAVTGAGDRRKLTAAGAIPGASVTYTPGDYADPAGNQLPGFTTTLLDALPPLVTITDPAGEQYVQATTYTIRGTASQADSVEVFRDSNNNDLVDDGEQSLGTSPVTGGAWSADLSLNPNVANTFVARGSRTSTTPQVTGPGVGVPDLNQDSIDPVLDPISIGGPFRGGQKPPVPIDWDASDDNFDQPPGPITIEYSKDGGAEWTVVEAFVTNGPGAGNARGESDPLAWTTPFDTTKSALIRVTATDKAGRRAVQTTSQFEIDSILPVFVPTIVDERHIDLGFSEPVDGVFLPQEWEIDGEPAGQIDPAGPATGVTEARLTLSPLAEDLDLTQTYPVEYEWTSATCVTSEPDEPCPGQDDAEIQDHVGNEVIPGDGTGSIVVPTQPPSGPDSPAVCTIMGTDNADTLFGTDGPDVICPRGGNDQVSALGGNDIIVTGPGTKTVDGGAGNDEVSGGDGFDTLSGGPGDDVIFGYGGDDQLDGGDGEDILHGDEGSDTLSGAGGIDILEGEGGDDHLSGGDAIDHLAGSDGNDSLQGDDGNDRLQGHAGDDQLRGGSGDDFLEGSEGVDILKGEGGNDTLSGSAGRDHLFGDQGNDKLEGGDDNDRIDGGTGNDVVNGGDGNDSIFGGTGNDRGNGGTGDDRLEGEVGKDVLIGGDGNDRLGGGSGNDELKGSDDNDSLYGGTGRDVVMGEDGRDRLYGEDHSDRLLGGSERDKLDGGTSRDFCDGGPSRDSKLGCEGGPNS